MSIKIIYALLTVLNYKKILKVRGNLGMVSPKLEVCIKQIKTMPVKAELIKIMTTFPRFS
jgi:hypothetical protein